MSCPFCDRIEQMDFEQAYNSTVVRFEPLNPVTPGHMLFVPWNHAEHPDATAVRAAIGYAARYAAEQREDFNLITSSGASATQTVPHIHVHYVPRRQGDGLALPWTAQQEPPMSDAPHDLTMAAHAKMLARSADALAKELGKPFPPWMAPRESGHGLASLVSQLADVVADLAGSLQARIDREDDLR